MPNFLTVKVLAWIAGALGVVILGLCVALWAQGVRVGKAQNERDKAKNQVVEAQKTIKGQVALLTECDRATKALKTESDKKQAEADEAVRRAQQEARRYQEANKRRAVLLASPTPSGAGCREAVLSIRQGFPK